MSTLYASLRTLGLTLCLLGASQAAASPSVFLESGGFFSAGYSAGPSFRLGGEVVVPAPFVDASLGLEALVAPGSAGGSWQTRLWVSSLILPAVGTTPPLAVGAGADLGFGANGLRAHVGPLVGTDLLFTLDLPMTLSLYLAPGYSAASGVSLAWAAQLRYYLENLAFELESTDLQLFNAGIRFLF
ncbi:MAG: hypothetical protein M3511_01535 [Deinococcota bacterium]|nr:hypothetical protein [Deinococcota bacterium]